MAERDSFCVGCDRQLHQVERTPGIWRPLLCEWCRPQAGAAAITTLVLVGVVIAWAGIVVGFSWGRFDAGGDLVLARACQDRLDLARTAADSVVSLAWAVEGKPCAVWRAAAIQQLEEGSGR